MHHYPHHIGDYRKNTGHLTNDQDLAYRRLLEMYYDTEQPIPLETQWVARRLRVDTESVDLVLSDFFTKTESGWKHDRCDQEIAKYYALAERNRNNGKLGGRPKKTQPEPSGLPVGTQSEPTGKPTKNQEPRTKNQTSSVDEGFVRFWAAYPKKIGKGAAEKSWSKAHINGSINDIIAAIEAQKKSEQWRKDGGQFIPNPATWINQRRWEDDLCSIPTQQAFDPCRGAL